MKVSIVILSYNTPEIIEICLRTLKITEGVDYEVVVVDNGSEEPTPKKLQELKNEGLIDTLVLEPVNHLFSGGNNIGVRHTNPESEYILLLNSDVAFLRPDWLQKQLAWMEGTIEYTPSIWDLEPTMPKPGPRDIVSIGWSHDANVVPANCRPEGWCCLIRRSYWSEMSTDFPWHNGFEEMIANAIRSGAKAGVLSQYGRYMVHAEGQSGKKRKPSFTDKRTPDIAGWFKGLEIETLDFTLGPNEHQSYLWW